MITTKTNYELVEEQMKRGLWQTTWEMQGHIAHFYEDKEGRPRLMSEAGLSARIRELKDHGLEYDKQPRMGTRSFEYRLKPHLIPAQVEFSDCFQLSLLISEEALEATR